VQDPFDPDAVTPEARTREVASILAKGYLRHCALRARDLGATCVPAPPKVGLRQPENEVDARANRSVHVPHAGSDRSPDQAAGQEAR